jgi:multidrug efflux system membrane fusion protein
MTTDPAPGPHSTQPPPVARGGKAVLILLLLLALVLGITVWKLNHLRGARGVSPSGTAAIPVPVTLGTVAATNFPIYLEGLGTVQAYNSVQVTARVPGLIREVLFSEGQEVKAGDILVRIDPTTYRSLYDQAVSKTAQDTAQLEGARILLARDQDLLAKNVLDRQTFDTQRYLVAQLEGTVRADKAAEEYQKTQLDWTTVTAPIPGRTGARQIDLGNQVSGGASGSTNGGSTIVTINQIQPIYVAFTLPQQSLPRIRDAAGSAADLPVVALEGNNRTVLGEGKLSMIDNQIDPATSTVRLKAVFPNADEMLWPGQFVNVRLLIDTRKNALVIPSEAVQIGPTGPYVYVPGTEGAARMQPVKTGPSEGGMTLIESGLQSGEQVVTDGQYRLQPGSRIAARELPAPKGSASPSDRPVH